jgi:hypothetical protein
VLRKIFSRRRPSASAFFSTPLKLNGVVTCPRPQ